MRGRKPLPNVVKMLRNSRQPRNLDEPRPDLASAEPPPSLDAGARRVWAEVVPELARLGLLTSLDVARMARTCRLESLGRRCLTKAQRVSKDQRAQLLMAAKAFDLADRVWGAFGVAAPGERARLRTPPREEDRLATFKARHRAS